MDSIKEILSTLDEEEVKEFKRFVVRSRESNTGKDLKLLDALLLNEPIGKKELALTMYPNGNMVAYQALRKRLTHMLNRFIALKLMDSDSSNASQVLSLVNMARYLYAHNLKHLGWKYLKKAERAALHNDLFEILNSIYVLQIQHLPAEEGSATQEALIRNWKDNKERLERNEQGEIALSLLSKKILNAHQNKAYESLDSLIRQTLNQLNFSEDYLLQPRFVYHLSSINRKKLLQEKDYFNLEPFLIQQYEAIENNKGFQSKHNYYKLGFLYMICHTLYRNKKFGKARKYHEKLQKELKTAPKVLINEFGPKAHLLGASLMLYQKKAADSVRYLEAGLAKKGWTLSQQSKLNFIINIGIAHFYLKQYGEAHKLLQRIKHSDKWCEKIMGAEWVMKKNLMEVILYLELEEYSLVDSRIASLQRSFRNLLQEPPYQRVKAYLKFLKQLIAAPDRATQTALTAQIEEKLVEQPPEQEDLQAMAFYAWLKAKTSQKDVYEVLLDVVNQKST